MATAATVAEPPFRERVLATQGVQDREVLRIKRDLLNAAQELAVSQCMRAINELRETARRCAAAAPIGTKHFDETVSIEAVITETLDDALTNLRKALEA